MTLSLNQAQDIVQKLSNEQLMQAYTSGTVPQFVVFSEMQRRQQMGNAGAKMPTQTVAEKMVGREEGIPSAMPSPPQGIPHPQAPQVPPPPGMPSQPPQMAARGGMTKNSTLSTGSRFLSPDELNMLRMRYQDMQDMESPMEYAEGGEVESPISNKDIARMIMPSLINVESGGRQGAVSNKGATGVAQLMPNTAPEAARMAGLPWDPAKYKNDSSYNSTLGHAYLTSMLDRFGDRDKALAAYNAGPGRLSSALQKEKETGRPWMSFMPRETQAYVPKVLGGAQAKLPPRQDPEGADTDQPQFGHDPAFGGGTMAYSGFQYPGKDQPSDVDKGLAAIMAAKKVQGLRFDKGGPVDPYAKMRQFAQIQQAISGKKEPIYNINPPEPTDYPIRDGEIPTIENDDPYIRLGEKENKAPPSPTTYDVIPVGMEDQPIGTGMESFTTPRMRDGADLKDIVPKGIFPPSPFAKWEQPDKKEAGIPSAPTQPTPPEAEGIASNLSVDQRPVKQGGNAPAPRTSSIAGGHGTEKSGGTGGTGGSSGPQDTDFASIFKQIQSVTGDRLSDEKKEQIVEHGKIMQSMKNDKLVDTLLAAAKTLAGQRVGQQNFGDAVANAGLAAQEAQKRIYKAEDDMRKYRFELAKAQDEGDQKAATIAMNRLIHLDSDRAAMARAVMQTNKYIQSQEASEKRTNIGVASKELTTMLAARNKLDENIRTFKADPAKQQDVQGWEADRARLDAQIAGARQQLHYFQTGQDITQIEAEMKKRGLL